jgi:hypothetical protein
MLNYFQLLVFQKCYLKNLVFRVNIKTFLNETATILWMPWCKEQDNHNNGDDI